MKTLTINKGEHLTDVLPMIPTDTILYKRITGVGATYGELKASRNSIILEPNKPVITGKCKDEAHAGDNLFAVFEGVSTDDVVVYLENTLKQNKYIKILTTPESFHKVQEAFTVIDHDMRFECFLLFDECHKIITDIDYRSNIVLPMDFFFECSNKALVSATPLVFTDPRFNHFQIIELQPTFDYKCEIDLHITNNVLQRMKEVILEMEGKGKDLYIFCNSTDTIYALMKQMDIMKKSAVFCSQKSVEKLKKSNFIDAHDLWNKDYIKHFNWFTSRFYNAFDLILEDKPIVLLFTDVYFTEYTAFNPYSDTIQCIGRFRNGVSEIHHITNVNSHYRDTTASTAKEYVRSQEAIYKYLVSLQNNATAKRDSYSVAIESLPYIKWLNLNMSINYFSIDNFINTEVVKDYYQSADRLKEAYSKYFSVHADIKNYKCGDFDRLKLCNKSMSIKEKRKRIVEILEKLGDCNTEMEMEFKR